MRFLVTGEAIDVGPVLPPAQVAQLVENVVNPSLEMITQWEQQGKATGGIHVGERHGILLIDADSPEEVHTMLAGLPFWGVTRWQVQPLVSIRTAIDQNRQNIQRIQRMAQGG